MTYEGTIIARHELVLHVEFGPDGPYQAEDVDAAKAIAREIVATYVALGVRDGEITTRAMGDSR